MVNIRHAAFVLIAFVVAASGAEAATCEQPPAVAIEVDVREAPVITLDNLSISDLQGMSAQLKHRSTHPVLGFYTGTVGYALPRVDVLSNAPPTPDVKPCSQLVIQAELIAVDRRIAVASDLSAVSCRLRAAAEHYRDHAAAASVALHRFASELPHKLGPEVNQYLRDHDHAGLSQAQLPDLRQYVSRLLEHAVATFSGSLADVQASVDTPMEVRRLLASCGDT